MATSIITFGADPTGANDSTQAIMNALNSGASHIIAPEGTYKIRSIDFTAWGASAQLSRPYIFDASPATFIHDNSYNDIAMVKIYPGETDELIRCIFKFGFLKGNGSVKNIVYIRHCNNCKIEAAFIGDIGKETSNATAVFCDQENHPAKGTFNNFIEIQDIADCQNGFTIYADVEGTSTEGFEGNIVKISRLGACRDNGLTVGRNKDSRVIFNTFILGPVEHNDNGYGVYERGGGNQYYINNLNMNGQGIGAETGLLKRSLFVVSNENSVDPVVTTEHFYTNVFTNITNM